MSVAEGTAGGGPAPPQISTAPTRQQKIKESLQVFASSKVAVVGFFLVAFWVIVAVFADSCTIQPTL